MARERLQKVLAAAGFGSRRACEELITDARVQVNGRSVDALPVLVDPEHDRIAVDGKPVRPQRLVYYLLHKPAGVLCTNYDPSGRTRAIDLMGGVRERVFPVGRLDESSTGLLLMTNDGELSERLAHPRYGVPKTYRGQVEGYVGNEALERLRSGVWLAEGKTGPAQVKIVHRERNATMLEITLREGKNREVRRMLARLGHKVRKLKRIRIGPLSLEGIPLGAFRPLRPQELKALRAGLARGPRPATARRKTAASPQGAPRNRTLDH